MEIQHRRVVELDDEPPWADLDATGDLRDDADDFEDALLAQMGGTHRGAPTHLPEPVSSTSGTASVCDGEHRADPAPLTARP